MGILVTGGAGFIGSVVANELDEKGHTVTVVDNEFLGTPSNVNDSIHYYTKSINSELPLHDIDTIYHLAGLSSLPLCRDNPHQSAQVNVAGTANLFEQASRAGVENIVQASTAGVYGTVHKPVSESVSVNANTLYESSKLSQEQYASAYNQQSDLNIASIRLASVYEGTTYSETHKGNHASVISKFAEIVHNGERPTVYGDGTQQRDFIHVDDAVRGLLAASGLTGIFNVGTGNKTSINKVVDLIKKNIKSDIQPKYIDNPVDGEYIECSVLDSSKLMSRSDWKPRIDIQTGINKVCKPY